MKILLFGKNGQVGWELQRSLTPLEKLIALDADSADLCGDFTDLEGIRRTIRTVNPDVIVNAAAYTAVDKAENEPELARSINTLAPAVLAEEAKRIGVLLVHYSTDYVFDGSGDNPWLETDPTAPLNTYGMTKLQGEKAIGESGCRHLIFRTSWIYSARGSNFVKTMLHLARERDQLSVINDQIGAPTSAHLLADVTAHAIPHALLNQNIDGIYHLAATGETSWHGYASFVIENARRAGVAIRVPAEAITPVPTSTYPTLAQRPLNSRLNTTKLRNTFNLHLPEWQADVERMLAEILEK